MAEIISNYTTLVSAVVNTQEDDSTEFRAFIPTAIGLAEDRMTREMDSQVLLVTTTVSATNGNRFVDKPSGYRVGHEVLFKKANGDRKVLRKRTRSYCEYYWPYEASGGTPVYYADANVSAFLLAPTPDGNSQLVVTHEAQPTKITAAVSTNVFTNFYPDALYFATMSEVAKFSKQWSQVQLWDTRYMEAIQAVNNEGRRSRRDSTEPLSNPQKVNNTFSGEN